MAPPRTYELGKVPARAEFAALFAGASTADELVLLREELRGLEQRWWPAAYQLKASYDWARTQGLEPAPQPGNPYPGELGRTYIMGAAAATILRAAREAYALAALGAATVEVDPTFGTVVGVHGEQLTALVTQGIAYMASSNLLPAFVRYASSAAPELQGLGFWSAVAPVAVPLARGIGIWLAGKGIASAFSAISGPWLNKAEIERQKTYQAALKVPGGAAALAALAAGNAATAQAEAQKPTFGGSLGTVLGLGVVAGLAYVLLKPGKKNDTAGSASPSMLAISTPTSPRRAREAV